MFSLADESRKRIKSDEDFEAEAVRARSCACFRTPRKFGLFVLRT